MKREEKILIKIIRTVISEKLDFQWSLNLPSEELKRVVACAKKHGVLPFLQECPVFMQEPYRQKIFSDLKNYTFKDVRQMYAVEELLGQFEKNGIYCMALKGIRTKQFYPYPEYRTMGDLDILYKEEQTELLQKVMKATGYQFEGCNIKHDEYGKDGVAIEMHRDVLFRLSKGYDYFLNVWDRAKPMADRRYVYEMCLEDHYLHTVYHLIEHFVRGGIGIRMVLDIYLLSRIPQMDKAYVKRELDVLGIQRFEENIRRLANHWFADEREQEQEAEDGGAKTANKKEIEQETEDEGTKTANKKVLEQLEEYALSGGIFGSRETERKNGTVLYQSKARFIKQLVFPSYKVMKTACPWLKTPVLLPVAWLARYRRALTKRKDDLGYHVERMKTFDATDQQERRERRVFFERCGLDDVPLEL